MREHPLSIKSKGNKAITVAYKIRFFMYKAYHKGKLSAIQKKLSKINFINDFLTCIQDARFRRIFLTQHDSAKVRQTPKKRPKKRPKK